MKDEEKPLVLTTPLYGRWAFKQPINEPFVIEVEGNHLDLLYPDKRNECTRRLRLDLTEFCGVVLGREGVKPILKERKEADKHDATEHRTSH